MLAQRAAQSLRRRRGTSRRLEAVRGGTADPGSALGPGSAPVALGSTETGSGGAGGNSTRLDRAGDWRRDLAGAGAGGAAGANGQARRGGGASRDSPRGAARRVQK